MARLDPDAIPFLEGWTTIPEAAVMLGLSRAGMHWAVFELGEFASVRKIGSKPTYVVSTAEVESRKKIRDAIAESKPVAEMSPATRRRHPNR